MIDTPAPPPSPPKGAETLRPPPALRPYKCTGWLTKEARPCPATVIDAHLAGDSVVRRGCSRCGTMQVFRGPDATP